MYSRLIDWLQRTIAGLMNAVRVNRIESFECDGVPTIVKRRRVGGSIAILFGNGFLALAGGKSRMFVRGRAWIQWELQCTELLYPERQISASRPGRAIQIRRVPGISLRDLVSQKRLNVNAIVAAARELRRVHGISCESFQSEWSHGDVHLGNVLYDTKTDKAVLIDFDTFHQSQFDRKLRHADDLLVFLLELMARLDENWDKTATAFIVEYRDVSVLKELSRQLDKPRSFAGILWHTRTFGASDNHLTPRIVALQTVIQRFTRNTQITPAAGSLADVLKPGES